MFVLPLDSYSYNPVQMSFISLIHRRFGYLKTVVLGSTLALRTFRAALGLYIKLGPLFCGDLSHGLVPPSLQAMTSLDRRGGGGGWEWGGGGRGGACSGYL